MKGLSLEIYDDEEFVPKFHNFDDGYYDDSEVESSFSERQKEDYWETLANIKQKTCEQLSIGDEVDKLIFPILNNLSFRQNTATSEREADEEDQTSMSEEEKILNQLIMFMPFFKIETESYLIGTMKR